jgi:hypothetical protein
LPAQSTLLWATKTAFREFRVRIWSLYDFTEDLSRLKELPMRPTKKRFVSHDRLDAILIGTSVALMILFVIVAV